jgi:hypothetical protein
MACNGVTTTTFEGCRFVANTAYNGGALRGYYANRLEITSCTFASNVAASQGGAIFYRLSGPLTAYRTIIAFSQANWAGAIGCLDSNQLTLTCCDLYGNAGGDWVGCIANQGNMSGNLSEDPLFCQAEQGDFMLWENSPCAPEVTGPCGLIGALDVGCGPIGVRPVSWAKIKARFR